MEYQTITNTFTSDMAKNLEIEAACSKISFDLSPDEAIHVEAKIASNGIYTCEIRQNTLSISYDWNGTEIINFPNRDVPLITISIPGNLILDQIDCDIAAGEMLMEKVPVSCREMNVEIGAGKWKATQLSVFDKLNADAGAGKMKLSRTKVGSLYLDCGAAKCSYEGRIEKDMKVNCGVGTCKFQLENAESDFDFDISCALGSIHINDRKINAFGSEKHCGKGTAHGKGILECGVGKIILETT